MGEMDVERARRRGQRRENGEKQGSCGVGRDTQKMCRESAGDGEMAGWRDGGMRDGEMARWRVDVRMGKETGKWVLDMQRRRIVILSK